MGSKSAYLEKEILDHIFKVGTWSPPTNWYIALCKATINNTHTGSTLPTEVSGGSYGRKRCNTWDTAINQPGATQNAIVLTYTTATAAWGTVTDFAIVDSTSGGNVSYFGKLSTAKRIATNDTAKFATGDIDITEQ